MLGEKIAEGQGKVTGQRVITENNIVKVETSFVQTGKLYGIDTQEVGTYSATMQPGGHLYGEGQGVVMTKDGDSATWKGFGVGKPTGKGMGATYRASLTWQSQSPKLAKLNGLVGV